MMRKLKEKVPNRCDPSDPTPSAAYVGATAELSIDERIRQVVAGLQPAVHGEEPSEEDLRRLEEFGDDESLLTPHQIAAMEPVEAATDVDRFVAQLSAEDRAEALRVIMELEEAAAPPDGAGAGRSPAENGEPTSE